MCFRVTQSVSWKVIQPHTEVGITAYNHLLHDSRTLNVYTEQNEAFVNLKYTDPLLG